MKKDSVRGWKQVFTFTLVQTLKSKSYIVSLIIMLAIAMISMPIMNLVMADKTGTGEEKSAVEKMYLYNLTMYQNMDVAAELEQTSFEEVEIIPTMEDSALLETRIREEEVNSVMLFLVEDESNCYLQFLRSEDGDVTTYELELLSQCVQNAYKKAKVQTLGLTKEQMTLFETSVVASSTIVDTENALVLEDTSISQGEYWFIYGMMFFVLMTCVTGSSQVSVSIVEEKSSKVIEYLLTSVRPLAVIVGKVLAMMVAVVIKMLALIVAGYVSAEVGEIVSGTGTNAVTQFMTPEMLESLNLGNLVLGLLVAAAGMILYATLAGLCGATASRMEEAGDSQMLFTMTSLVGFYIGFGAASTLMASGDNGFVTFALIFPISSAFFLPAALLVGKANALTAIIAIAVLLVSVVLMFMFVAKVYEALILHNGTRIKMKEVIAMARGPKKQKAGKGENAA